MAWYFALIRVEGLDAMLLESGAQLREMLLVAGFNRAHDVHSGDIGAGESSIVHDLFDAGTRRGDFPGEISQSSRSIADYGGEPAESPISDQSAFNNAT